MRLEGAKIETATGGRKGHNKRRIFMSGDERQLPMASPTTRKREVEDEEEG